MSTNASFRETTEWQCDEQVLRVDCLGNLVDDMADKILVQHSEIPVFLAWLSKERLAATKFGVMEDSSR